MRWLPKSHITPTVVALIGLLSSFTSNALTCISISNGAWSSASTWSCGAAPNCGDSLVIQAGHTITVTANEDLTSCASKMVLVVKGTLKFNNGRKLRLPCNSRLYIFSGGQIQNGGGGGNSNVIEICGNSEWSASDGTYSGPGCMPPSLPGCNAVLPVELISFQGNLCNRNICLAWATATEKNNDYYLVEKMQDDFAYTAIGIVKSSAPNGTSYVTRNYLFEDRQPSENINYYRLKQVDKTLDFTYSPVIAVDFHATKAEVLILPNNGSGQLEVKLAGAKTEGEMQIRTSTGQLFFQQHISTQESLFIQKPVPGLYFCYLNINGAYTVKKFIVE